MHTAENHVLMMAKLSIPIPGLLLMQIYNQNHRVLLGKQVLCPSQDVVCQNVLCFYSQHFLCVMDREICVCRGLRVSPILLLVVVNGLLSTPLDETEVGLIRECSSFIPQRGKHGLIGDGL